MADFGIFTSPAMIWDDIGGWLSTLLPPKKSQPAAVPQAPSSPLVPSSDAQLAPLQTGKVAAGSGDQFYDWASKVLQGINAPVTSNNVNILYNWAKHESGSDIFRWNNPLNTTQQWKGAVDKNGVGVKQYASFADGIQATIRTLNNGFYSNIIAGLQNNLNPNELANAATPDFGTWGSGSGWLRGNLTEYDGQGGGTGGYGTAQGSGSGGMSQTPSYQVDGHTITQGSADDVAYQMANSLWKSIYLTNAPYSIISIIKANKITDKAQLEAILNEMPSHIAGWNIGQYDANKQAAQKISDKYFGRPIPDSLMKQFAQQGISGPVAIDLWFQNHGLADIPKEDYQQIFDAALPYAHGIVGDVPHPSQVYHFYTTAKDEYQQKQEQGASPIAERQRDRG